MPQLNCYVSDTIADRLQQKAEQSQMNVSEYLVSLIKHDLKTQWPDDFFDLFGAWEGESLKRGEQGGFEQRLELD